jgi:hypothetical protein
MPAGAFCQGIDFYFLFQSRGAQPRTKIGLGLQKTAGKRAELGRCPSAVQRRRRAFRTTMSELADMPMAATQGGT